MARARADWAVALVMLAASAFLFQEALAMPDGPGTFPRAVALLMGVLSLGLLVRNVALEGGLRGIYWHSAGPGATATVLWVVGFTMVYVGSIGRVSYVLSTGLYFAVMMWLLGLRPRWLILLIAPSSVLLLWVVFVRMLNVSLS
ncbi:MAG: tripartite tricarboxylate transporter TctB family protein [Chloroflexi bacterium]|nr:tripartite tricarboxylate transporter TctB family protein [Chloroflexota bacterium]